MHSDAIQAELLVSDTNRNLLTHATEFINRFKSTDNVVLVSGSRSAADELVYLCCDSVVRGVHRFTLRQLTSETARPSLAARGWITAEQLPLEAIIRQLIHSEETRKGLNYFGEVSSTPHFAKAVYQTLNELRWEGITPDQLIEKGRAGSDLAILLRGYEKALTEHGLADGAACAAEATHVIGIGEHPLCGLPVLLHCVPIFHHRERDFMEALVRNASMVRAVTPTYRRFHQR